MLVAALAILPGCTAVALSAGSMAASMGIDHTMSGITYKTFTAPQANLRLASLKALSRMDMDVVRDEEGEDGWEIEATAAERTIEIELESLTATTTRMRVVCNKGDFFFKDSATATEVIVQTIDSLEDTAARTAYAGN